GAGGTDQPDQRQAARGGQRARRRTEGMHRIAVPAWHVGGRDRGGDGKERRGDQGAAAPGGQATGQYVVTGVVSASLSPSMCSQPRSSQPSGTSLIRPTAAAARQGGTGTGAHA